MANEPDRDEPDWGFDDSRKEKRRGNGDMWKLMGTAAAVIALATGGIVWAIQTQKQRQVAIIMEERHAEQAAREAGRARGVQAEAIRLGNEARGPVNDANTEPIPVEEAVAQNNLGLFLLEAGDYYGAVDAFRKAARIDPRYEDNVNRALKLRDKADHTAPPPREVALP